MVQTVVFTYAAGDASFGCNVGLKDTWIWDDVENMVAEMYVSCNAAPPLFSNR